VKRFRAPKESLGDLEPEAAADLVALAADIAIVLDAKGVIRDLAFGSDELAAEWSGKWLGQPWIDTVTVESRPKVEALLRDATSEPVARWRHVNHPSPWGSDVPIMYAVVRLGDHGTRVAVGRDLRATAALQQKLIEAQQAMERNYSRLRQVETRYRLLFQVTIEAVLVVDASTQKIVEANPAAAQMLGESAAQLVGKTFPYGIEPRAVQAVQALLATVRASGRPESLRVRLSHGDTEQLLQASLFRQESTVLFLIRLVPIGSTTDSLLLPPPRSKLLEVLDSAPDAFVVTTAEGRIIAANAAFLDMAQLATEEQARGESLDRWLGRPGVDLNVLIANLRQHGSVRLFATTMRGEYGATVEIEVSAVWVPDHAEPCLGFMIRNVSRRIAIDSRTGRDLPRSVEQLTELVGRVPLKDLVRETTDVIERLCIETALELTGDNRASAAEILGLSRQSLYVKLRRYGLGDLTEEVEE
jgi:transcriptional regulator PpsR